MLIFYYPGILMVKGMFWAVVNAVIWFYDFCQYFPRTSCEYMQIITFSSVEVHSSCTLPLNFIFCHHNFCIINIVPIALQWPTLLSSQQIKQQISKFGMQWPVPKNQSMPTSTVIVLNGLTFSCTWGPLHHMLCMFAYKTFCCASVAA